MEERHVEILLEDIRGKFDLVLEGHDVLRHEIQRTRVELHEKIDLNTMKIEALNEKIDTVDQRLSEKIDTVDQRLSEKIDDNGVKIETLGEKLDAVAADLSDHRRDTELHGKYRVCEKP
jgi:chromosome segregation ATPase